MGRYEKMWEIKKEKKEKFFLIINTINCIPFLMNTIINCLHKNKVETSKYKKLKHRLCN